jgi:hypothetical protein
MEEVLNKEEVLTCTDVLKRVQGRIEVLQERLKINRERYSNVRERIIQYEEGVVRIQESERRAVQYIKGKENYISKLGPLFGNLFTDNRKKETYHQYCKRRIIETNEALKILRERIEKTKVILIDLNLNSENLRTEYLELNKCWSEAKGWEEYLRNLENEQKNSRNLIQEVNPTSNIINDLILEVKSIPKLPKPDSEDVTIIKQEFQIPEASIFVSVAEEVSIISNSEESSIDEMVSVEVTSGIEEVKINEVMKESNFNVLEETVSDSDKCEVFKSINVQEGQIATSDEYVCVEEVSGVTSDIISNTESTSEMNSIVVSNNTVIGHDRKTEIIVLERDENLSDKQSKLLEDIPVEIFKESLIKDFKEKYKKISYSCFYSVSIMVVKYVSEKLIKEFKTKYKESVFSGLHQLI